MNNMGNTAAKMNYYALLVKLDQKDFKNCKVGLVDAGLGGEFSHTNSLHIMTYKEAVNNTLMIRLEKKKLRKIMNL